MNISNVITDLSHWNAIDFEKLIAESGIRGIIHKATQGSTYVDPTYKEREKRILETDLLWGAYHFGEAGNGEEQAEHFLKTIDRWDRPVLLALDLETNPKGNTMTLQDAEAFIQKVQAETELWPVVYGNKPFLDQLILGKKTILTNCPLWLAQWREVLTPNLPNAWTKWHLWQYTDGKSGSEPHEVEGVGPCDRDKFNGTLAELEEFWCSFPSGSERRGIG